MKNVTYFHSDTKDKKVFAYKSTGGGKNPQVQMCHVFKAPSKSKVSSDGVYIYNIQLRIPVHYYECIHVQSLHSHATCVRV